MRKTKTKKTQKNKNTKINQEVSAYIELLKENLTELGKPEVLSAMSESTFQKLETELEAPDHFWNSKAAEKREDEYRNLLNSCRAFISNERQRRKKAIRDKEVQERISSRKEVLNLNNLVIYSEECPETHTELLKSSAKTVYLVKGHEPDYQYRSNAYEGFYSQTFPTIEAALISRIRHLEEETRNLKVDATKYTELQHSLEVLTKTIGLDRLLLPPGFRRQYF